MSESENSTSPLEKAALALVAAAELLRKQTMGDNGFHKLLNAVQSGDPPEWAVKMAERQGYGTSTSPSPSDPRHNPDLDEAFGVATPSQPQSPAPPTPDRPTSNTPAFERPTPVIVVGPKPLPVNLVGGKAPAPPKESGDKGKDSPSLLTQLIAAMAKQGPIGGALGLAGNKLTKRGTSGQGGGAIAVVLGAFASKFGMILAPLTALSTVLSASNSGMQVFQKSVQLLGATLAPLLMPVMMLLATAVTAVSDVLWENLLPAMKDWTNWVVTKGIPAIQKLAEFVDRLAGKGNYKDTHGVGVNTSVERTPLGELEERRAKLAERLEQERKSSTWVGRRLRNTEGSWQATWFEFINLTQREFTGKNYQHRDYRAPVTALTEGIERLDEEIASRRARGEQSLPTRSGPVSRVSAPPTPGVSADRIREEWGAMQKALSEAPAQEKIAIQAAMENYLGGFVGSSVASRNKLSIGHVPVIRGSADDRNSPTFRVSEGRQDGAPVGRTSEPPVPGMSADRIRAEWQAMQRTLAEVPEGEKAAVRAVMDDYLGAFIGAAEENREKLNKGWVPALKGSWDDPNSKGSPGGKPKKPGVDAGAVFKDMVTSLQRSLGPQAAYHSLTEVNKQAQLTALNSDPIEARMLQRMIETVKLLQGIKENTDGQSDPTFNGGGS